MKPTDKDPMHGWKEKGPSTNPVCVAIRAMLDEQKREKYIELTGREFTEEKYFANTGAYTGSLISALKAAMKRLSYGVC